MALVRRVLGGDREAFRPLVEKYQGAVYHAAWRVLKDEEEARDAAQETFLKAYSQLGRFDSRYALATWLLTIATRTAINMRRGRMRLRQVATEDMPPGAMPPDPRPSPVAQAISAERKSRLKAEIEKLGERARLIFSMRYEDKLPLKDIADATGQSLSSVKVLLHRARKTLRQRLAADE
ncbi:MAG: RNA polymerase sigma factor [Candidatus Sumerlaeota bacterium]